MREAFCCTCAAGGTDDEKTKPHHGLLPGDADADRGMVFGLAQMQSTRAKQLNGAVILAQNAAEAAAASETPEELLKLLNDNDNAVLMADTAGVTACYDSDLNPDAEGNYRVDVTWLPEETENGILVHSVAEVRCDDAEAPVYRLETERFWTGVSA